MRDKQLRVWFAPEEMRGGRKIIEQIDRAIQVNHRLPLVLSKHSMESIWVLKLPLLWRESILLMYDAGPILESLTCLS